MWYSLIAAVAFFVIVEVVRLVCCVILNRAETDLFLIWFALIISAIPAIIVTTLVYGQE